MTGSRMLMLVLIATAVCMVSAGVDAAKEVDVTFVGSYDTPGWAEGVAVSGDYAYVADGHEGLVIVDISNKTAPVLADTTLVLAGSYDGYSASDVVLSGDYAYVTGERHGRNGLMIEDVSNPAAPVLVGKYDFWSEGGFPKGVAISGDYAYVANGQDGLMIVDVSNKAAPTLAGSYDTPRRVYDVAVSGEYAYVAGGRNGLVILDISSPTAPTLVGNYDGYGAHHVILSGDYAYVASGSNNDLLVMDVSNPTAPTLAGIYDASDLRHVTLSGDYAYVIDYPGLLIVNISSPAAPTLAGSYYRDWSIGGCAVAVAVSGDYMYVAGRSDGLVILRADPDTTPPTLDITSPVSGITEITSTITVSGTASDDFDIADITVDGVLATGTTSWSMVVRLTEGENTITVVATDGTGLITTETVTVIYTPPAPPAPPAPVTEQNEPGFEGVFAITGLLVIAYLVRRQRRT